MCISEKAKKVEIMNIALSNERVGVYVKKLSTLRTKPQVSQTPHNFSHLKFAWLESSDLISYSMFMHPKCLID